MDGRETLAPKLHVLARLSGSPVLTPVLLEKPLPDDLRQGRADGCLPHADDARSDHDPRRAQCRSGSLEPQRQSGSRGWSGAAPSFNGDCGMRIEAVGIVAWAA